MKTLILPVLLMFQSVAKGQITLEHSYANAGQYGVEYSWQQLYVVHLELAGDRYLFADKASKKLKFYRLNHTLWKTIDYSMATDINETYNMQNIMYVSQHLFDNDDEIEFMYIDNGTQGEAVTEIIDESGNALFSAIGQAPRYFASSPQDQLPIYNTEDGTKMILSDDPFGPGKAHVYHLPGTLSSGISSGPVFELAEMSAGLAYPNPTATKTRIDYSLPTGVNEGFIVLYTTGSQEVKRFRVDRTFNTLEITTDDLQSGTYYYNLQTTQGVSGGNRLVTIK